VKAAVAVTSARKTMYNKYVYETMERQSSAVQFRWIYILVFYFFFGETVKGTVVLAVIFHFYNNIIILSLLFFSEVLFRPVSSLLKMHDTSYHWSEAVQHINIILYIGIFFSFFFNQLAMNFSTDLTHNILSYSIISYNTLNIPIV